MTNYHGRSPSLLGLLNLWFTRMNLIFSMIKLYICRTWSCCSSFKGVMVMSFPEKDSEVKGELLRVFRTRQRCVIVNDKTYAQWKLTYGERAGYVEMWITVLVMCQGVLLSYLFDMPFAKFDKFHIAKCKLCIANTNFASLDTFIFSGSHVNISCPLPSQSVFTGTCVWRT